MNRSDEDIFSSEAEMQSWLSNQFQYRSLRDLVINIDEFIATEVGSKIEKKIFQSFSQVLDVIDAGTLIAENSNISLNNERILKPDFLFYSEESESIVIVELKNSKNASRQVGTEVSAYASEVKSYIPFISDGDIANVIISTEWSTLLCHYISHEIFWLYRDIICLEPTYDQYGNIRLRIVDISLFTDRETVFKISPKHLGGIQICMYDYSSKEFEKRRKNIGLYVQQMRTAIAVMAKTGNSKKSHGFAILWRDKWQSSIAPYSITLINFAPFQTIERFFQDDEYTPSDTMKKIIDIIKDHAPNGHSRTFESICSQGTNFLKSFCSPVPEGFQSWEQLKYVMLNRSEVISFSGWGIFGELHTEKLMKKYAHGEYTLNHDDGVTGIEVLNELIDDSYNFIDLSCYDNDET